MSGWAQIHSHIRDELIKRDYCFDVQFNGTPGMQRFEVNVNGKKAKIWPSPSVWGEMDECYWGIFIEDKDGKVVGREYPDYDPDNSDACYSSVKELFVELNKLSLK